MLQRIQSIYLLLAAAAAFALFAVVFVNVSGAGTSSIAAFQDGDFDINDNMTLKVMAILCGAMAIANIFLFSNRKLQLNIGKVVILLNVVLGGLAAFFLYQTMGSMGDAALDIAPNAGFAMPILGAIFTFLANRNINKDEKLVKSAYNRLR